MNNQFKKSLEYNPNIIETGRKATFMQTIDIYTGTPIVYMIDKIVGWITQIGGQNYKGIVPPDHVEEYLEDQKYQAGLFKKLI